MARRSSACIALAAGGTPGHVYPAIAIAVELERRGWETVFLGTRGGREAEILARYGYPLVVLPGAPYQGQRTFGRMRSIASLTPAVFAAASLLRRRRVAAVIGFGGYAAAGPVLAARFSGRLAAILEPNRDFGMANRLLARFADRLYVGTTTCLPDAASVARTGVPIREDIVAANGSRNATATANLLVLGDAFLDAHMPAVVGALLERGIALRVVHQGPGPWAYEPVASVACVTELDDIASAYAAADLVICRAGAGTLAEIAATGSAAIVVPLAGATKDHQTSNAEPWRRAGAAVVLPEREWTRDGAIELIAALLMDRGRRQRLSDRARSFAAPDAARALVDDLLTHLARHPAASAGESRRFARWRFP